MEPILELLHVSKEFKLKGQRKVQALFDVSLKVNQGETLGIVGESGCGKSTLARTIMGVYPGAGGQVLFHGEPLNRKRAADRLKFAASVQMVFQDPYTSLNPRMTVEDIIGENLLIHNIGNKMERREKVREMLAEVGLHPDYALRFPSEFSGGQRQRIGIARALILRPELLVCDEPISALDVSVQSQIMNLLSRLKKEMGLTYIFIAHDLNMVHYISDRVAVMYMGHVVEVASPEVLYVKPCHPYTVQLLDAVLGADPKAAKISRLDSAPEETGRERKGENGCPYYHRCVKATERCACEKPTLTEIREGHLAACHYASAGN